MRLPATVRLELPSLGQVILGQPARVEHSAAK
jgi:hypothetical protein